jgi:hypothetical protein
VLGTDSSPPERPRDRHNSDSAVLLFHFQHEGHFWGNAWACIRAGTLLGVLAAVPLWLILRRGALLSPSMTGAAKAR